MKKTLSILLALVLVVSSMALAESTSNAAYLFDEVRELLFDTHNVTVSVNADFTFDGLKFKEMDFDYKQDGTRSYLSYLLDTYATEGAAPVRSGYTVLGTGSVAYSNEVRRGNYYNTFGTKVSDTLLRNSTKTALAVDLARTAAVAAESTFVENEKNGNTYNFSSGAFPDFVNKTAYYLLTDYLRSRYYVDIYHESEAQDYVEVRYEGDWLSCVQARFEALYGRAVKEDYYDDNVEYGRFMVAESMVNQIETEVRAQYRSGFVLIRKDGSYEWFPNRDDCCRAAGIIELHYADDSAAFRHYYKVKTGKELSQSDYEIIMNSPSDKLWQAVADMSTEMTAYYTDIARAMDPMAVSAEVAEDGTVTVSRTLNKGKTLTQTITENVSMASLTNMLVGAQTDDDGKLIMGWGTLDFEIDYLDGSKHTLTIGFSATVTDRGTTSVPEEFVAEDWGLVSVDEYYRSMDAGAGNDDWWDKLIKTAPDTIEFAGATYETQYSLYR